MEIWKSIINYEGRYEVSDHGRVRSLLSDIILKEATHYKGHKKVWLYSKDQIKSRYFVHRLVAFAFIPQTDPDRIIVNHKDGNKTNNYVENLEWMTCAENTQHYYDELKLPTEDIDF